MANYTLSKEVYSHLMNGKMLNKHLLDNAGDDTVNPLFIEIIDNKDEYVKQYKMSGYHLVIAPINDPEYIYIVATGTLDGTKTELAMKAMTMLLVIGQYINHHKFKLSKLTNAKSGGLTQDDFLEMADMPHVKEILEKSKLITKGERTLQDVVIKLLVHRDIMIEVPSKKAYILTNAGHSFYQEIQRKFDTESELANEEDNTTIDTQAS